MNLEVMATFIANSDPLLVVPTLKNKQNLS